MNKENKIVGFWYRVVVIIFDIVVALSLPIGFSTLIIESSNTQNFQIIPLGYYLWLLSIIIWFSIYWLLIPFFTNGYTLGRWIFRIKLIVKNNKKISSKNKKLYWLYVILKNQTFTSIAWILMIILSMILINPELAYKIAASTSNNNLITGQNDEVQKIIDQSLIAIPSTFSTFLILINFFIIISTIIRKDKTSLAEAFSNTKLVYVNKFTNKIANINNNILNPIPYKINEIIFLDKLEKKKV